MDAISKIIGYSMVFLGGSVFAINYPWPNPDHVASPYKCLIALGLAIFFALGLEKEA